MKFANISLFIVVILIVLGLLGLSSVFAATGAGQVTLLAPRIDVEATARAIKVENRQTQLEDAARQRLQIIQAQIDQTRHSLDELERIVTAQASQQNAQLAALQGQAAQQAELVDNLRATATFLRQAVPQDETDHQTEMMALQAEFEKSEAELNASLQTVLLQIAAAEARDSISPVEMPSRVEGAPISITSPSDDDSHSDSNSDSDSHKSDDKSTDSDHDDSDHSDDDS